MGVGYAGFTNEMMIGFYGQGQKSIISDLSLRTLVDFGYELITPGLNEGLPDLSQGIGLMENLGIKMDCQLPESVSIVPMDLPDSIFENSNSN